MSGFWRHVKRERRGPVGERCKAYPTQQDLVFPYCVKRLLISDFFYKDPAPYPVGDYSGKCVFQRIKVDSFHECKYSESVSVFIETRPRQRPTSMSRKKEDITSGEM